MQAKGVEPKFEVKIAWFEEITRETEHYFQGEVQQDQRASWLLATNGVLVAVLVGIEFSLLNKHYIVLQFILILAIMFFLISSGISIITILPFKGTRFWTDFFGSTYRRDQRINIEQLIEERFQHGGNWSIENYERRLLYHFRSHYLRFQRKAYGILWSAITLIIGLLLLLIVGIEILL